MKQMAELKVAMTGSSPLVAAKIKSVPTKFLISSGSTNNVISAAAAAE